MNRHARKLLAEETVRILQAGGYTLPSGRRVDLADDLWQAVRGTSLFLPDDALPDPPLDRHSTRISVQKRTTLAAARALFDAGREVAALNFASARNPGGGFLGGSEAQEESLARNSGLYACLLGRTPERDAPDDHPEGADPTALWREMYSFHRHRNDPLYTHRIVYSPNVPVFRGEDGALLADPWRCSILTAPAANARDAQKKRVSGVGQAMRERTRRVLAVAALQGHDTLVLGAWGCGVFGNDPGNVAGWFDEALSGPFRGVFAEVVFAVPVFGEDANYHAFKARFG